MGIIEQIASVLDTYFEQYSYWSSVLYLCPSRYAQLYRLTEENYGFQRIGFAPRLFFMGTEIIKDFGIKGLYIPRNPNKTRQVHDG